MSVSSEGKACEEVSRPGKAHSNGDTLREIIRFEPRPTVLTFVVFLSFSISKCQGSALIVPRSLP